MKKWTKQSVLAAQVTPEEDQAAYDALVAEMRNTPAYKELDRKCAAQGYTLKEAYITTRGLVYVIIQPNDRRMAPEIYPQNTKGSARAPRVGEISFRIQTFSIGSLPTPEFHKYLATHQKAYELAVWLEEWEGWGDLLQLED